MVITSIALDGCSIMGIASLGALRRTHELGVWDWREIKTVVGISSGSIAAVMIMLTRDWDTNIDYVVKRPWDKFVLEIGAEWPLKSRDYSRELLRPLLTAAGVPEDCTLQELFELTNKNLVIVTCGMECNKAITQVALSHQSHPTMTVIEACARSCSLVPLFQPIFTGGLSYIDGGFANGNSAYAAMCELQPTCGETLHIEFVSDPETTGTLRAGGMSDSVAHLLHGLQLRLRELCQKGRAKYTVTIGAGRSGMCQSHLIALIDCEERQRLVETGRKSAELLIARHLVNELRQQR